ncbi:MAG: hypothetical protein ACLFQB_08845 [Chitinispirillaceae bacterium]
MAFSSVSSQTDNQHNFHKTPDRNHLSANDIAIVVNKRLKKSWRVRVDFKTGKRTLTIPAVLADPPAEVHEYLIRWAMLPVTRKERRASGFKKLKRELENQIRNYMESKGVRKERVSRINPVLFEHQTKGFNFDLKQIFNTLNRAYFGGEIESYLRWGQNRSKISYQTCRIDRNGNLFNLITISGIYDSPLVPEYVIYGVMYHEMLHIAIPPRTVNGRRVIHGKDFKKAERKYPFYDLWIEWEQENMGKLLAPKKRFRKRR